MSTPTTPTYRTAFTSMGRTCRFLRTWQAATERALSDLVSAPREAAPASASPEDPASPDASAPDVSADTPARAGLGDLVPDTVLARERRRDAMTTAFGVYEVLLADPDVQAELVSTIVVRDDGTEFGADLSDGEAEAVPADVVAAALAEFFRVGDLVASAFLGLATQAGGLASATA